MIKYNVLVKKIWYFLKPPWEDTKIAKNILVRFHMDFLILFSLVPRLNLEQALKHLSKFIIFCIVNDGYLGLLFNFLLKLGTSLKDLSKFVIYSLLVGSSYIYELIFLLCSCQIPYIFVKPIYCHETWLILDNSLTIFNKGSNFDTFVETYQ